MICLKTKYLCYEISSAGQNISFHDNKTGYNRVITGPCAKITLKDKTEIYPTSVSLYNDILSITFSNKTTATIRVNIHKQYLTFTLDSVSNEDFHSISFVNIELKDETSAFHGVLLSMTRSTHMMEHPGDNRKLVASAYPHIGLFSTAGSSYPAKAAVIGAAPEKIRAIERLILDEIPDGELPKSKKGGPYADLAAKEAQGVYTICMDTVTLENVEDVIADMHRFGITQINLHHYGHYRHGDFTLNKNAFPNGMNDFKKVIDRFHQESMLVGLQPYSFFLVPESSYVTPIPHPDLDTLAEFTLAKDMTMDEQNLSVSEDTTGITAEESYILVNSPYLWIDDELVRFTHAENGCFTLSARGAYNTIPAVHKKGSRVRQLKQYFMLPCAKAGSSLFYEIARNIATFYNECGADMFYLDALDGAFILDGEDYVWYHAVDFINEMFRYLKRDPIFNCCFNPQYSGSWFARTRYGAMDVSLNAHREFYDAHVKYNKETAERMGVTPELGWIDLYTKHLPPEKSWQNDPIFPEDLEYLCAKAFATDASFAFLENFRRLGDLPCSESYAAVLQKYVRFRENAVPTQQTQNYLYAPENGAYLFDNVLYKAKYIRGYIEESGGQITIDNPFGRQIPTFRMETLCAAADYDDPKAVTLCDLNEQTPITTQSVRFKTPVSSKGNYGLGVWCKGDNSGAIVCVKIRNLSGNKRKSGEHFIRVNFIGWKYFAFYENQNSSMPKDKWPRTTVSYKTYNDLQNFYGHYRPDLDYDVISGVDIEVKGSDKICLKPLRLLPHTKPVWKNPIISFGNSTICVQTCLKADSILFFDGKQCIVTDHNGSVLNIPTFTGSPIAASGKNRISVTHTGRERVRAKITVNLYGDMLQ